MNMFAFRKIVENILSKHGIELKNIESNHYHLNYDKYKDSIQNSIKESMYEKADELDRYFESLSAKDIKKTLNETDNTQRRKRDLTKINCIAKFYVGVIQKRMLNDFDFYIPQPYGIRYYKMPNELPDLCLAPVNDKGIGIFDGDKNIIFLCVLNDDGTYDANNMINLISNNVLYQTIVHELTHWIDFNDSKAKSELYFNKNKKSYADDPNELNAFTNQIIKYIDVLLKQTVVDLKNEADKDHKKRPYSWKQATFDAINELLSEAWKEMSEALKNISDNNLKKMYRTVYEYFYDKYFKQYISDHSNPDQYNEVLKNISKENK